MQDTGKFVISLDFELMWGVRDQPSADAYGDHILGVWEALPRMVEAFEAHGVKATFATVGFLFAGSKRELLAFTPNKKPDYAVPALSPYNGHFDRVADQRDPYHLAAELIDLLRKYPDQEIATHTFSHYYCLEAGQTLEDFRADIRAAIEIATAKNIELRSLVFPRNQFNAAYVDLIGELGISAYRGNERAWFYRAAQLAQERLHKRAFRLLDAYLNLSGHNCYRLEDLGKNPPYNIPSSRFLRPYAPRLKFLENLRLNRILTSMRYAAKNRQVYHLWWHPHNFGVNQEENFSFLEKILRHYNTLNSSYGFQSMTMREIATLLSEKYG